MHAFPTPALFVVGIVFAVSHLSHLLHSHMCCLAKHGFHLFLSHHVLCALCTSSFFLMQCLWNTLQYRHKHFARILILIGIYLLSHASAESNLPKTLYHGAYTIAFVCFGQMIMCDARILWMENAFLRNICVFSLHHLLLLLRFHTVKAFSYIMRFCVRMSVSVIKCVRFYFKSII